jgi:hypothetical protein
MAFYSGKEGVTQSLQQHNGALEFIKLDEVRINGSRHHIYEVRRYRSSAGWEFKGRVEVRKGPDIMSRAVKEFWFLDE